MVSRWWFQIFFIFTPTWGNDSISLIFCKWVEGSTNYCRVPKGGVFKGGGNWGTLRIPREDWGTLGNSRED